MALSKGYDLVWYAYCQCSAVRVGTCSHMFAVINLALKWAIDKRTEMSEIKACTLKTWLGLPPQSLGKLFKSPILEISIISLALKKLKAIEENTTPKGIKSSQLYMMHVLSHKAF